MRLFPLCLQFWVRELNNFKSTICHIRLRGIRRKFRELTLIKEQNDEVARVVSNIADRAKALFKNISLLVHSINIREDTQIYDLSQPRKRKRMQDSVLSVQSMEFYSVQTPPLISAIPPPMTSAIFTGGPACRLRSASPANVLLVTMSYSRKQDLG
jgi:hypothetical protein